MTYIISGKLNKKTFLMADCKVKLDGNNIPIFTDKVFKLDSSKDTYCTLAGKRFMSDCIKAYDHWLKGTNRKNDFLSGNRSIRELIPVIKKFQDKFPTNEVLSIGMNRVFFISSENVVYYDLFYDESNELEFMPKQCMVNVGYFIDSNLARPQQKINLGGLNVKEYCMDHLSHMPLTNFYIMDRFTFLLFTGKRKTVERPIKNFSDIIISYYGLPYNDLDIDAWTF